MSHNWNKWQDSHIFIHTAAKSVATMPSWHHQNVLISNIEHGLKTCIILFLHSVSLLMRYISFAMSFKPFKSSVIQLVLTAHLQSEDKLHYRKQLYVLWVHDSILLSFPLLWLAAQSWRAGSATCLSLTSRSHFMPFRPQAALVHARCFL